MGGGPSGAHRGALGEVKGWPERENEEGGGAVGVREEEGRRGGGSFGRGEGRREGGKGRGEGAGAFYRGGGRAVWGMHATRRAQAGRGQHAARGQRAKARTVAGILGAISGRISGSAGAWESQVQCAAWVYRVTSARGRSTASWR